MLDKFDVGNDFGGGAVSNLGYDTKQQYDSSVPATDLWENNTTITDFFYFSYELFLCVIMIILNSVIGTFYSTNNINIVTLLTVYTHCIKLWM